MKKLALCTKYYMNPNMLELQYAVWSSYPADVKKDIEIVIVDDGSPGIPAVDVPRPSDLPDLRIFRILEDRPWHQNGATNLGAFVAQAPWLILTDMDHVVSGELANYCANTKHKNPVYMFNRVEVDGRPTLDRHGNPKPHPNSYLIKKTFYWQIGGHDEWFCGLYGTDRLLRQRIRQKTIINTVPMFPIKHYTRDTIPDASTTTLPRKEGRHPRQIEKRLAKKALVMDVERIVTLNFPWEQVL